MAGGGVYAGAAGELELVMTGAGAAAGWFFAALAACCWSRRGSPGCTQTVVTMSTVWVTSATTVVVYKSRFCKGMATASVARALIAKAVEDFMFDMFRNSCCNISRSRISP